MESEQEVLWDVVDEYLDQAGYVVGSLERVSSSGVLTLEQVALGQESRLRSYVEAAADTPGIVERLLTAALADDGADERRAAAASLVALELDRLDLVAAAVLRGGFAGLGAEHALSLVRPAAWCDSLNSAIEGSPPHRTALLRSAAHCGVRVANLLAPLQSDDEAELAAGAHAAAWVEPSLHLPVIESLLDHAVNEIADAATVAALAMGSARVLSACEARVAAGDASVTPLLALAMFGDARRREHLLRALARPEQRAAALFASGFSGSVEMVPALLSQISAPNPRTQKLAVEAFGMLTGLDTRSEDFVLPELAGETHDLPSLDDDLAQSLAYDFTDELPRPDANALSAWWVEHASQFTTKHRWLLGEPWSITRVALALERVSMRCRQPLALWLRVSTKSRVVVHTRALPTAQRAQLAALPSILARDIARRSS